MADADHRLRRSVRPRDHLTLGQQHPLLAVPAQDPLLEDERLHAPHRALDVAPHALAIIRVQVREEALHRAGELARAQAVDVMQLVGPADPPTGDLPPPHAEASDALGLRHAIGELTHVVDVPALARGAQRRHQIARHSLSRPAFVLAGLQHVPPPRAAWRPPRTRAAPS